LKELGEFIKLQDIPKKEPIIIFGDLNIDQYDNSCYQMMLKFLNAQEVSHNDIGHNYSFDSELNSMAAGGSVNTRERLDHILVEKEHQQPRCGTTEIFFIRTHFDAGFWTDLSDHFPVRACITFPVSNC